MAKTTRQFKKYYCAINYLETLARSGHDQAYMRALNKNPEQFLERTRDFIKHLGNPHRGFRYIHVSGTSGKGSTVAHLHNILRRAGYKVGSFTSPHSTTSIERIKVNDKLIDPIVFAKLVDRIKPVIEKMSLNYKYGRPSYFEIFFGVALLYFKKMKCDWVVLEVGCGGTYDAGNIIEKSISATTNIGLDHTHLLGNTLSKIAREKIGIIKPNTHFFTTEKREKILKIFKDICREKNAKFHHIPPIGCPAFVQKTASFQKANICLAIAIARHLKIDNKIIERAIKQTALPCRFEIIQKKPLVILDGAHNPDKIKSVVHNLKNLTYDKLYTMFASGAAKNARRMINQLARVSDEFIFTTVKNTDRKFYEPLLLSRFAQSAKKKIEPNPRKALQTILKKLKKNNCLLITGSFYLAGEARKRWMPEEKILMSRTT